jgi:hypothetical protein
MILWLALQTLPPALPDGQRAVTHTSERFLRPPCELMGDVDVATTPPTIDFSYAPGQDYPGKPWSAWGDALAVDGRLYYSFGDHHALGAGKSGPHGGNAFIVEYDPAAKAHRRLLDVQALLKQPPGHYTPGKIHSRLDLGSDGWLYASTHRGSTGVTKTDAFHFQGDWIVRVHPGSGRSEIVARAPLPKHGLPNGLLDPDRLIWYAGTAHASGEDDVHFLAYDVKAGKTLYAGEKGPSRSFLFARSTGKLYYVPGSGAGPLMRYDPAKPGEAPVRLPVEIDARATSAETPQGVIYAISKNGARLSAFHTRTEEVESLGDAAVGSQTYVASLDADPTGRYLYYVAGAHGGSDKDGTPVVRYDTRTRRRKVLAFLHPFYQDTLGCALRGTYATAVDPSGDKLYIVWNANRAAAKAWDTVALTVIHIPEAERTP